MGQRRSNKIIAANAGEPPQQPMQTHWATCIAHKPVGVLSGILAALCVNLVSWVVFTMTQGGDALNGKVEGGRYYLGSHGRYTEVSARKYQFSRCQTVSNMVTLAILIGGSMLL